MKKLLLVCLLLSTLLSCVSSSKYSRFVDEKIQNTTFNNNLDEWLLVKSEQSAPERTVINQDINSFIPAIIYWGWNSELSCQLAADTRFEFLKEGIVSAAQKLNLKEKIGDRELEITMDNLPGEFIYNNKGHVIFLFIAYASGGVEMIYSEPYHLTYNYKLTENKITVLQGNGLLQGQQEPIRNVWKSTKKFTWRYIDEFQLLVNSLSENLVRKIIRDCEDLSE